MEKIYKIILGVFVCVIIIYSGLGILRAYNDVTAAENYLHKVGNEISASNLNEDVIIACQQQAQENGYTLNYQIVKDTTGKPAYVNLELYYDYSISFIKLSDDHVRRMTVF